jgi:hypothetical protein
MAHEFVALCRSYGTKVLYFRSEKSAWISLAYYLDSMSGASGSINCNLNTFVIVEPSQVQIIVFFLLFDRSEEGRIENVLDHSMIPLVASVLFVETMVEVHPRIRWVDSVGGPRVTVTNPTFDHEGRAA